MTTKSGIKKLIDSTETQYLKCWDILCSFKNYNSNPDSAQRILEFQPILSSAIYSLEKKYCAIHQDKEKIIKRKNVLSPTWFRNKLKLFSDYQSAIKSAISIGKSIGDAFAWFFYQNERGHLIEHLKHKKVSHMPTGIGGIGELEFLRKIRGIEGHLTIYHGTTNILRLGDVSFIDLKTLELTAIGEIKTKKIDQQTIQISLFLIGPKIPERFTISTHIKKGESFEIDLPDKMKSRLKRQIKNIAQSFESLPNTKLTTKNELFDKTYIPELNILARNLKTSTFTYRKAGNGLLLVAYKNNHNSLSSKVMGSSTFNGNKKLDKLVNEAFQIIDKTSTENSIGINSLHYSKDSECKIMPGMVPTFWWPIGVDFLKKIYFHDALIFTLFNPLYILRRLKSFGFTIDWDENRRKYKLTQKSNEAGLQLENFDFFLKLVSECLFSEEMIFELIERIVGEFKSNQLPLNTRIQLQIFQLFWSSLKTDSQGKVKKSLQ